MSRENGFYKVYCRNDLRWKFREFCDGKWEDYGRYESDRDFKIAYEVPEQEPVNPVPATWASSYYAIEKIQRDSVSDTQWSLVMHYDTAESAIKAAIECTRDDGRNVYRAVISTKEVRVIGKVE